ncbi:FtsB family cell division protein [Pseudothioclava arenosa]|uniref:Septum formation initiator n=1 Tax=Pseudothioclava arenosa TaxID=1795308 RepID=A0A2A4CNJ6_9RHOB|nr:septum formation initiator family protein [Pseudothioclava arenosa]PCD75858.1 septum formation initiator precursor [Pseudothioclava arenosa]
MSKRLDLRTMVAVLGAMLACAYFAMSAIQGGSGIFRRVQIEAEIVEMTRERDALRSEVERMANLTHRLSDAYLDLDLLDERARDVLGTMRSDEIVIR